MGIRNQLGNLSENKILKKFQENNYWVHKFINGVNGQPCDIIAIKGTTTWLVDAKHCEGSKFSLARIEPNQHTCFEYAHNRCNIKMCGFMIHFEDDNSIRWLPYEKIKSITKSFINKDELQLIDEVI